MGRSAARVHRVQKVQIFATHTDVFLRSRCPAPVISTEAKWSSEISLRNVTSPMVAGDLSTLRFIRAQNPCHPYRRVPPLEMTVSADSIQSFPGANYPKRCPASPVISTAAKRSGEISLRNVASLWWQEISRLCVSLEPKVFAPIPARSSARGGSAVLCDLTVFNGARAAAQSSCFPLRGNAAQRQKGVRGCV